MSWAKLGDEFYDQPATMEASLEAVGLHALALSYCARHLTDGKLTRRVCEFLSRGNADRLGGELVAAGMWVADGDGFALRDYLSTNLSAKDAKLLRKAARARMQNFRKRSGNVRANKQGTNTFVPDGTGRDTSSVSSLSSEKKKQPKPCRTFPDDFVLTELVAAKVRAKGCRDPEAAFAQFRNHHLAKGSRMASWPHAWSTWVGNHGRYGCDGCPATAGRAARPTTMDAVHSYAAKLVARGQV
jgi:hypothetical protein